jgi:hypothetical protein
MAVIAKAVAMVGREDDDRIVKETPILKGGDDFTNLSVDHSHVGEVVGTLIAHLGTARLLQVHNGVEVAVEVNLAQLSKSFRLLIQIVVGNGFRQVTVFVEPLCIGGWIVGRVGAW